MKVMSKEAERRNKGLVGSCFRWTMGGGIIGGAAGYLVSQRLPFTGAYFFGLLTAFVMFIFRSALRGDLRRIAGAVIGMVLFGVAISLLLGVYGEPRLYVTEGGAVTVDSNCLGAIVWAFLVSVLLGGSFRDLCTSGKTLSLLFYLLVSVAFTFLLVTTYLLIADWEIGMQ